MSTIVSSPPRAAVRVTSRGVAAAEWIKLRSLRSAAWLLAGIVVSIVADPDAGRLAAGPREASTRRAGPSTGSARRSSWPARSG